jgi:hypothetical protein
VDTTLVGVQVIPFKTGKEWQYSGYSATLGAQWDVSRFLRLGGSVIWSGDLKAEPTEEAEGERATFDLPMEYRLGASGVLSPGLVAVLGVSYADWSPSADGLEAESVAGAVWSFGGGLEWTGMSVGSRELPVRLGYKRSGLPFTFEGENPVEKVFSGGLGLNLVRAEDVLIGSLEMALEKGTRDAGALSEDFWRGTVTFRVASW